MSFRYGVLALLAEEPRHGYELKTAFEQRMAGSWTVNIGQVYTTLRRLERDGLVETLGQTEDRRDYRITGFGRSQLDQWFSHPVVADEPDRDELMVKVLLAVAATDIDVSSLIQRQRTATFEQLQGYTQRKAKSEPTDLAFLMMLDALIYRCEAEIRWLDACESRINESQRNARTNT
jgi:DNA-binding PadR family transcriptional regulator